MLPHTPLHLQFSAGFPLKLETADASEKGSTFFFFFTYFHFSSYHFCPGPHDFTHGLFRQTPSCSPSIRFHANLSFIVLTKLIFLKHCFIISLSSSRMMWFLVSCWINQKTLYLSPFKSSCYQSNVSLWTLSTSTSYRSSYDVLTSMSVPFTMPCCLSSGLPTSFNQVSLFPQCHFIFIFSESSLTGFPFDTS